ncbi:AIPR family protein [Phaeobacter sp. J2-8]|uniref:AIPR family protein n=1 Tax=Phaeobacter sp. J2-8 TaxID=2931394 RepID=UPI001FD2AB85|nr:AIPR family protein [Phaeobacter sp. J2-8]
MLCSAIDETNTERLGIHDYVVVNGAQSLTSLLSSKASITADLRVLVKVVALGDDAQLSEKITHNSNNQNAIKARDQKSNNPIQQRLKKEVAALKYSDFVLEVKQGELNPKKEVLRNEDSGLALLAVELGEPWTCHQKYKVMDESHAKIFGRSDVTGAKLVFCHLLVESMLGVLDGFDDPVFGHYNLTKYFLAHAVSQIVRGEEAVKAVLTDPRKLFAEGKVDDFVKVFAGIASTTVDDLNAEIGELIEEDKFDHKRDLKSPIWCKTMTGKLVSAYKKDVKRKRVDPIDDLFSEYI